MVNIEIHLIINDYFIYLCVVHHCIEKVFLPSVCFLVLYVLPFSIDFPHEYVLWTCGVVIN